MPNEPIHANNPQQLYDRLEGLGMGGALEAKLIEGTGTQGSVEFTAGNGDVRSVSFDLAAISADDAAALIRSASNLRTDSIGSEDDKRITHFH